MSKSKVLLGTILLAGVAMLSGMTPWVSATGQGIMARPVDLTISGLRASPLLTPSVLVIVTAVLAAAITASVARRVSLVIAALGGVGVAIAPIMVGLSADSIAQRAALEETSANQLIGSAEVSPLRFVTLLIGLAVVALAVAGVRLSSQWGQPRTKYERTANVSEQTGSEDSDDEPSGTSDTGDLIDLWDSQTAEAGHQTLPDPGTLDRNERNTT